MATLTMLSASPSTSVSFARSVATGIETEPLVLAAVVSAVVTGGSFTGLMVSETVAVLLLSEPSFALKVKLSDPL